jgi:hypothetical protein
MRAKVFVGDSLGVVRPGWLTLKADDIEEAVLRCGWTLLNAENLRDVTEDDRAEIDRILGLEAVGGFKEYGATWWRERFEWESARAGGGS